MDKDMKTREEEKSRERIEMKTREEEKKKVEEEEVEKISNRGAHKGRNQRRERIWTYPSIIPMIITALPFICTKTGGDLSSMADLKDKAPSSPI